MEFILIYGLAKVVMTGITWISLRSSRKNIANHIDLVKLKPTTRKRIKMTELNMRYKLTKIITPCILIPGVGDVLFLTTVLGRFSNKRKIEKVYQKSLERIDNDNLKDALDKAGALNSSKYMNLKRDASFLSVQGHSEIARQSILTLNNLLIDANIAGIDLRREPSISEAIKDTSDLVASLVREEQSGIQSNIDTYLNVVESIKSDLIGKKAVFIEDTSARDNENKK